MKLEQALPSFLLTVAPSFFAALFYGVVSGSMSFLNKIVLTSYRFNFPDVVMFAQVTLTSIFVEIARLLGLCDIPRWSLQRGTEFAIPSLCFAAHTILALSALSELSIPIYNVLRRMLPLASLMMAIFILKKPQSRRISCAIGSIVIGTFLAGAGDLSFHLYGYLDALASVFAQSIYLTYVQKTGVEKHVSALSVLHLNSINCILPLLVYTIWNKNLIKAIHYDGLMATSFIITFLLNVSIGCILNYSLFLCTTMNSALTTSVVGVAKGVITTIIGFFYIRRCCSNHTYCRWCDVECYWWRFLYVFSISRETSTRREVETPITRSRYLSHCKRKWRC